MIDIDPTITLGQILTICVPMVGFIVGTYTTYLVFRTKTRKEVSHLTTRVVDLGKDVVKLDTKVDKHKNEAEATYVKNGDFQRFEAQIKVAMSSLSDDVRTVIGTTSDVRDTVLRMEARSSKDSPKLPPARRKATSRSSNSATD
ncbi:hypothetical protein [Pelagibacterium sp.]|uniref:hypothetical protein n=1 Tax=Pelagibacterium sp. TaxID=1967288 RepID=UPI003A93A2FC